VMVAVVAVTGGGVYRHRVFYDAYTHDDRLWGRASATEGAWVICTAGTAAATPAKGAAWVRPAKPKDAARIVAIASPGFAGKRVFFSLLKVARTETSQAIFSFVLAALPLARTT
jgi:hypothetical protein